MFSALCFNSFAAFGGRLTIAGISGLPKGIECPDQVNPSYTFDYNENFDWTKMDQNIPQFLQDIMKQTPEWNEKMNENVDHAVQSIPKNPEPIETERTDLPF